MANTRSGQALADALSRVEKQAQNGVLMSAHMKRVDRERLLRAGWLKPIIKGWYLVGLAPDADPGSTVLWYSRFWDFARYYLAQRFGEDYCLSAETSLDLHTGATTIPPQLVVILAKGGGQILQLPHNTSLLTYPAPDKLPPERVLHHGLQIMPLPLALCRVTARYFETDPLNAELALRLVEPTELSRALIAGEYVEAGRRLVGAYRFLGERDRAERIKEDMLAVGYSLSPVNPFQVERPLFGAGMRVPSPMVGRLHALWASLRGTVLECFPKAPGLPKAKKRYLDQIADIYQHDAYNSLSIEGYHVTPELIAKVRSGKWEPQTSEQDREQVAAMAAKGYQEAFASVQVAIAEIIKGAEPAGILEDNLQAWYRALFSASVQAGIISATDLAGFRNRAVFIRGSQHVPPPHETLMDCMEALFTLIRQEPDASVRAVLGHFLFVYIHPYPDGNGRVGRFLMNAMLASGGYPWTVIRLKRRTQYMEALEHASAGGDIRPFSEFVLQEMQVDWGKETVMKLQKR